MTKRISALLLTVILTVCSLSAANRAFRVVGDVGLYEWDAKHQFVKKVGEAISGDTVYANSETAAYLSEDKEVKSDHFPVTHFGRKVVIDIDNLYPIRLEPTDTLEYLTNKVEAGSFREQRIIPAMTWAMNYSTNPLRWMYLVFIALGCALLFRWVAALKGFRTLGLALVGVALAVTSGAEVMYLLAYEPHATWFLKPSVVGGWGHVILNFIILAVVCSTQAILFYNMWCESFTEADGTMKAVSVTDDDDDDNDDDDDDEYTGTPKWIKRLAYLPLLVGVYAIILIMGKFSSTAYFIAGGALVAAALVGAIYQFSKGRIIQGLIFPIFYVLGSVGIAVMTMILSVIIILVAIVGVVFGFLIVVAFSFLGGLFSSGKTVDFTDQYGNKHKGQLYSDGTIKGDDGNTYKI